MNESQLPCVDRVTLDGARVALSALFAQPCTGMSTKPLIVALHGRSMRAEYFHGKVDPSVSLLTLAAGLGYPVLAPDRPGYGLSADSLPEGQTLAEQSATLGAALDVFCRDHGIDGYFLLAHSYGGKVALRMAADEVGPELLGLDIAGCGQHYSAEAKYFPTTLGGGASQLNWGPLHLYPPGTFRSTRDFLAPIPSREETEAIRWPTRYPDIASKIRVPVRLTFAEHEHWWRVDDASITEMLSCLGASSRVETALQSAAGHNISLGWAARPYHLRALAFLAECSPRA